MKKDKDQIDRPTPKHPWIQRLGRVLVCVLLIVLILRITLWLSLPWLLSHSAQRVGLRCEYEELNLSLTTGDMEAWHLRLIPTDSNDPLVDMEYCRANVSILSLFAQRLIVDRVEVDGIDITVMRESDGSFRGLHDLLALAQRPNAPTRKKRSPSDSEGPIPRLSLDPHLRLRALRLQHAQIHYVDHSVTPRIDTLVDLTFRLSNLGYPQHQTRFQLSVASEPILNQLIIEGTALGTSNSLKTNFRCRVRGLHT
ncbi:MAG: hypothetical protein GY809_27590, partial [Planctomycetes bacterium]|nr:hypothetical protein [Planctomycetota bacterium]